MQKRGKNLRFLLVRPSVAKRGQFYLVAAIIITTIVISLVVVNNYSEKQEYTDLNSLRDEIQIEGENVLDYSINNGETDSAIKTRMEDFSQKYIDLESRDKDLYFIFGTQSSIEVKGYQKNVHSISLNGNIIETDAGAVSGSVNPGGSSVNLKIDSDSHFFTLGNGQSFYFVLSKDVDGGVYLVKG